MVGLIPLFAVETLEPELLDRLPGFKRRLEWFIEQSAGPDRQRRLHAHAPDAASAGCCRSSMRDQLRRVLRVMLDETRVPLAVRHPRAVARAPGPAVRAAASTATSIASTTSRRESTTGLFGGNSNWRGPIWFPVNYLLIESLQKFHHYFGDDFKVECPTGSGQMMTLWEVAAELSRRLVADLPARQRRPAAGVRRHERNSSTIRTGATWSCSTSTSTATTARASAPATRPAGPALVAKLLQQSGERRPRKVARGRALAAASAK